ncbi:type III effector protein [Streptomyces kunmingensis]|uniref:Type III effector protein n=1 Tax=Streptomyces kunmingensis TaxID=68225 RepID=A0ABU6C5E5_9ACTN|nr:type III effector protein [Streptomyces kunmingensis]MEB3959935.1 type III effector protein [Streptomyces kunmingensis]
MSQPPHPDSQAPDSFHAAYAALQDMTRSAQAAHDGLPAVPAPGVDAALDALILLRELRGQIAGWEASLIETARGAGASWASLAQPMGVNSRQAAERRYLRLRPGAPGSTGDQRAQAVRDERAAERHVTSWARAHAGELRQLAGQLAALADLPSTAQPPLDRIRQALDHSDAAQLLVPLADLQTHLTAHPALAQQVDRALEHADAQRAAATTQRGRSE